MVVRSLIWVGILFSAALFGVALALGAQDVFKNIFAGIFILSENRFQKGDRIRVGNSLHGIVDQIGFIFVAFILAEIFVNIPSTWWWVIPFTLVLHIGSNLIAYFFGWKEVWY